MDVDKWMRAILSLTLVVIPAISILFVGGSSESLLIAPSVILGYYFGRNGNGNGKRRTEA